MKNFRVYKISENKKIREASGKWTDKGKIFIDNINFDYKHTLKEAKKEAKKILKNTSEKCIAIENIKIKKLYLLDNEKTVKLSGYKEAISNNKEAFKNLITKYPCYTLEKKENSIIAFCYN